MNYTEVMAIADQITLYQMVHQVNVIQEESFPVVPNGDIVEKLQDIVIAKSALIIEKVT